jgi:hypothetical protein
MTKKELKAQANAGIMLMPTITYTNLMAEALDKIYTNTEAAVQGWGEDAEKIIFDLSPVDTGSMALSVKVATSEGIAKRGKNRGKTITRYMVHVDKPAAHQEFGTAHNRAHPFIFPGIHVAKRNRLERIAREGLV